MFAIVSFAGPCPYGFTPTLETGVTLHAVADTLAADLVATHTVTDTSHVSDSTRVSYTIHKLKVVD